METAAAAKEAAVEKMRKKDFSGARELAVEAQKLSPGMEGVDQMIVVCNVHCAAAGDGRDWYKILDVAAEADEAAVRRRCGRLAVALHPDKKAFPGAVEAFELIVEAKAVLGDSERRRVYDSMCRAKAMGEQWGFGFSRFRSDEESNGFARFREVSSENWPSGARGSKLNESSSDKLDSKILDDDVVEISNFGISRYLSDGKLKNSGGGLNWDNGFSRLVNGGGGRGRGRGSKLNEPSSGNEAASRDATIKVDFGFSRSNDEKNGGDRPKRGRGRPRGKRSKLNEPSSIKENVVASLDATTKVDFGFSSSPNSEKGDGDQPKRGRGRVSKLNEPSNSKESVVASQDATTKVLDGNGADFGFSSGVDQPKRGRGRGRGQGRGQGLKAEVALGHDEGEIACRAAKRPKNDEPPTAPAREADKNAKRASPIRPNSEILEYTDAEFNDFEQERSKACFKAGQIWAVYDTLDAMPRFYAMINSISDDQALQITWLEPLPNDDDEKRWLYQGLPASFGRFKHGYSEVIKDYAVFSHLVSWKRDAILRKLYVIRPQKGETWAVFKNWEMRHGCSARRFREFEYKVVEILSDCWSDFGVSVAFLSKIEGFCCVFGRKEGKGVDLEVIGVKDRLRFSHRIPSLSVSVGGGGGVGGESLFELDPAALPRSCR